MTVTTLADGRPPRRPRRNGWVGALIACLLLIGAGLTLAILQPETAQKAWALSVAGGERAWVAVRDGAGVATRWTGRQVDHIRQRVAPEPMGPDVVLAGVYEPADDTARAVGPVVFEAASLTFGETALTTRPGAIVTGADRMSLRQTWAEAFKAGGGEQIEVRQVTDGEAPALCGGQPVGWIALQPRNRDLTLAAFGVGEMPAADMAGADLCGVWRYRKQ